MKEFGFGEAAAASFAAHGMPRYSLTRAAPDGGRSADELEWLSLKQKFRTQLQNSWAVGRADL